jgi:hypothetical protein
MVPNPSTRDPWPRLCEPGVATPLDDRAIPILQRARTRETSRVVIREVDKVPSRRVNPDF